MAALVRLSKVLQQQGHGDACGTLFDDADNAILACGKQARKTGVWSANQASYANFARLVVHCDRQLATTPVFERLRAQERAQQFELPCLLEA